MHIIIYQFGWTQSGTRIFTQNLACFTKIPVLFHCRDSPKSSSDPSFWSNGANLCASLHFIFIWATFSQCQSLSINQSITSVLLVDLCKLFHPCAFDLIKAIIKCCVTICQRWCFFLKLVWNLKTVNLPFLPLPLLLLLPNRALPPLPPLTYNISGARQWQDPEWSELEDRESRKSGEQAAALVSWWQNQRSGRYAWEQGCPGGSHPGPLKVSRGCELSSCQCVQCSPTGKSPSPSGPTSCTTGPSTMSRLYTAAQSVSR